MGPGRAEPRGRAQGGAGDQPVLWALRGDRAHGHLWSDFILVLTGLRGFGGKGEQPWARGMDPGPAETPPEPGGHPLSPRCEEADGLGPGLRGAGSRQGCEAGRAGR